MGRLTLGPSGWLFMDRILKDVKPCPSAKRQVCMLFSGIFFVCFWFLYEN